MIATWGFSGWRRGGRLSDGSVVVGSNASEAFYWTQSSGMLNLREHLISQGVGNLTGWFLLGATGISDDGLTITGGGINPSEILKLGSRESLSLQHSRSLLCPRASA